MLSIEIPNAQISYSYLGILSFIVALLLLDVCSRHEMLLFTIG